MRRALRPGITYLEMIIAISLVSIIVLALSNFVSSSFNLWRLSEQQASLQEQTRKSLKTIIKEIREIQTADNGAFAIESAQATTFVFFANVDSDDARERVRYFLQGSQLMRGIIDPVGSPATYPAGNEVIAEVADNIYEDGALFSYFDELYTGVEDPLTAPITATDVHLIQIHFLVDADPASIPEATDITTQVTPRNLKQYAPN